MRSLAFTTLTEEEFDAFSAVHPHGNFQQNSRMGNRRKAEGAQIEYVGVRENDSLVAATQLEIYKSRLSTFAMIHDGPLCDFDDSELTSFFFSHIREIAKRAGAAQLEITPEAPYLIRDSDGNRLPSSDSDDALPAGVPSNARRDPDDQGVRNIESCGFEHAGFTIGYSDVPRWRYVKDLSAIAGEKELLASYAKNTKRNVRIAHDNAVTVEKATRDQLTLFHDICQLSCEKQGFENHTVEYFESLFDALGDRAEFNIAYFDTNAYLDSWKTKRDGFAADVERLEKNLEHAPSPDKVQRKLDDVKKKYDSSLKRIAVGEQLLAERGEKIPAAAAMFCWHERECVYLFSGSDPEFAKFYAASAIQHHVMLECIERGVHQYNFYGINGVFDDKDDPGRGLLEFKQGFGGYVQELMGTFELTIKPITYKLKRMAHSLLGR